MAALIKLGDLADQLAFEKGEQGPFNFQWYLYHLIQCTKLLRYNTIGHIKTVELEMGDDLTVQLPADYVDWTKVGTRRGNRVETMTVNKALVSAPPVSGNEPGQNLGYYFANFDSNGNNIGQVYGYGGGNHGGGHFKEDRDNDRLIFDSDVNTDFVYLEYITNGIAPCGDTTMHPYCEDTLLRYVDWRIARKKFGNAHPETTVAKREFTAAKTLLNRMLRPFTKKQFLEMWRKHYGLAIRV